MNTLQAIIFPHESVCSEQQLYFRASGEVFLDQSRNTLRLSAGSIAKFDTYFNMFSSARWRDFTVIDEVWFKFSVRGQGCISVVATVDTGLVVLVQQDVETSRFEEVRVPLPPLCEIPSPGIIWFSIRATSELEFSSAVFETPAVPRLDVHLGMVITAFRRDALVVKALQRLDAELLGDPKYSDHVQLVVVDNGRTLAAKDLPPSCTLIPNRNLGGAGGFARGLMHYELQGAGVTHCLFMDDDASCEVESIRRIFALLSYATDPTTAVCGAMLLGDRPYLQHEAGARFDMRCIRIKEDLDLRSISSLLENDVIEPIGYGGWWLFAFPLSEVKHYPFPYFVRGDDVLFTMVNRFHIVTLNGIASWQDSFGLKSTPLTDYLDIRSHLCHYLIAEDLKKSVFRMMAMFAWIFHRANISYRYASARAICLGLVDNLGTPSFWEENIELTGVRDRLTPLVAEEQLVPMQYSVPSKPRDVEHPRRWLLRLLSMNGHIFPKFLLKHQVVLEKIDMPLPRNVYGFREVVLTDERTGTGCILKHDKPRFLSNGLFAVWLLIRLFFSYPLLKRRKTRLLEMMTREFWCRQFRLDDNCETFAQSCNNRSVKAIEEKQ